MTTVFHRDGDGPRTHVFVVGVGRYPHCGRGSAHTGDHGRVARSIKDLSCAVPSAVHVAEALVELFTDDSERPLGSMELLLSADEPVTFEGVEVAPATFDNVQEAYGRWSQRGGEHPGNLTIFYFCGHGVHLRSGDALLLEDLGRTRAAFFDGMFDFARTRRAMDANQAGIQCYFVDACRDLPEPIAEFDVVPRALDTPRAGHPAKDAPVVHAALPGQVAYSEPERPTPFATAIVQALRGSAASQEQHWQIDTLSLVPTINRMMRWNAHPTKARQVATEAGNPHGGVVRVLRDGPEVPFRYRCTPAEALKLATLNLSNGADPPQVGESLVEHWNGRVPTDKYRLDWKFAQKQYRDDFIYRLVVPPYETYEFGVER